VSQQLDKYHERLRDGLPSALATAIPFVDPHIMNPVSIYKKAKSGVEKAKKGFGNEVAKTSKFFDKNNAGDIRDDSVEKKTGAVVLLDAAYLNNDKGAQQVMETLVGKDPAKGFADEWPKVHAIEQQIPQTAKANTKRVNPFVDENLKMDNFVSKYQGQKPVPVTAQNDPNGFVLHFTENGLGAGTRPPRYVLEPDPSVAEPDSGKSPFPADYNKSYGLKNYDRKGLGDAIGKNNIGPKGKWSEATNEVKDLFGKGTYFPDQTMIQHIADKLSASPTPRNPISWPSGSSSGTSDDTATGGGDPVASTSAEASTSAGPSTSAGTSNAPATEPCE
jgi:hypothetical protein